MIYRLLSDLTVLVHFFWILFLVFGIVFALKRSRIAWVHLGGLLFSLIINLLGWYCPLTYLENFLYHWGGTTRIYEDSFIAHYLMPIIYPALPEGIIRTGEVVFVCLNLAVYGVMARRYFIESHGSED